MAITPVARLRLLKPVPGIGPKKAQMILADLIAAGGQLDCLAGYKVPRTTLPVWPAFLRLLQQLTQATPLPVAEQIRLVVKYYTPVLRETAEKDAPFLCGRSSLKFAFVGCTDLVQIRKRRCR